MHHSRRDSSASGTWQSLRKVRTQAPRLEGRYTSSRLETSGFVLKGTGMCVHKVKEAGVHAQPMSALGSLRIVRLAPCLGPFAGAESGARWQKCAPPRGTHAG